MLLRRTLNLRSVKERVDLLLAHFLWNDAKNRKKSGTEEEYPAIDVLLQHLADLATEYSYQPPRSTVRKYRAKKTPASASETAPGSASGSTTKWVRPTAQDSWDDRHIAALKYYAAESAAEISNQSAPNMSAAGMSDERTHTPATTVDGPSTEVRGSHTPSPAGRSENEETLAFLEARYDQDVEMRLLSYLIERTKLDLKIRQHEENMKLLHKRHADGVRLREAEMKMRRMEMMAVLEERRANTAYQASQVEFIKGLIERKMNKL
ncbi:hypothetical protein HPB51_025159 [Rhipicephalus microplus]|uniref:Uncharacterized protein n=1 Tax=Rhipicephalus microplus TaxID=6941 RepID=A0A9J6FAL4_RHIMP|nr:hypothetical protein HPB51_025159 [Rhipicephalus microplus]